MQKSSGQKTNQFGEDKIRVPEVREGISEICPVEWLLYMVCRIPAQAHHNLFSFPGENGEILPVTYKDLTEQLRTWLAASGVPNVNCFSMHSLCKGGIMHAFNKQIREITIQQLVNWSSLTYKRYIDITLESRLKAWYMLLN